MTTEQAPLISGSTTGGLGLAHLPRLWLKLLLHENGMLPEGYSHGNAGTDKRLMETFGIDPEALLAYVASELPDYPTFEQWVRAHATKLNDESIAGFNTSIREFVMPDPRKSEWSARFGLRDDRYTHGIEMNQLDDWDIAWRQLQAADAPSSPVIPAISTTIVGPLGVMHLPRLWLKCVLFSYGRLPEGYRHGVGGFDEMMLTAIGVDRDAFVAFVEGQKPSYLETEAWVERYATKLDAESIAAINARIQAHKMPADRAVQVRERLHISEPIELGIPLNDFDDWDLLHGQLAAART